MATKNKAKKKRYWVNVIREVEGDCLEVGPYAYGSKDDAIRLQAFLNGKKVISFTI